MDYRTEVDETWRKICAQMEKNYDRKKLGITEIPSTYKKAFMRNITYDAIVASQKIEEKSNRVARAVGMVHLLMSEAIHLIDEVEEMTDQYFRSKYGFGYNIKMMNKYFDNYCRNMSPLLNPEEVKRFNEDFDAFDKNVRSFARLEGWKESSDEDRLQSLHDRFIALHKDVTSVGVEYVNLACGGDKGKAEEIRARLMAEIRESYKWEE